MGAVAKSYLGRVRVLNVAALFGVTTGRTVEFRNAWMDITELKCPVCRVMKTHAAIGT